MRQRTRSRADTNSNTRIRNDTRTIQRRRYYNHNIRNSVQMSHSIPFTFTISGFGLSRLALSRFTTGTIYQYRRALDAFCGWIRTRRAYTQHINSAIAPSIARLDQWLAAYCRHLRRSGGRLSQAQLTLSAAQAFRPNAKRHLPNALAELSGWRSIAQSNQHPPLTWPLTCAIAYRLALDGHSRAAVCVLLAFDCLLRVGEVVNIHPSDVFTPIDKDPQLKWFVFLVRRPV